MGQCGSTPETSPPPSPQRRSKPRSLAETEEGDVEIDTPKMSARESSDVSTIQSTPKSVELKPILKAPGTYLAPPAVRRNRRRGPPYPVFAPEASYSIAMLMGHIMTPEVRELAKKLGGLEFPLEQLLLKLLQVGHTISSTGSPDIEKKYTCERRLERLIFLKKNSVEKRIRSECILLLIRWYQSGPLLMKGNGIQSLPKTFTDSDPIDDHTQRRKIGATIVAMLDDWRLEDLTYAIKVGVRGAVKKYALSHLDTRKELEIRRNQELRRSSWWEEVVSPRSPRNFDPNFSDPVKESYDAWRRKTISPNQNLISPLTNPTNEGKKRYTIVLDLDETLIYTRGSNSHLCLRPGSRELLSCLRTLGCEVVVWTASTKDYSAAILSNIDPDLEYISECVYRHPKWFEGKGVAHPRKDLSLLGRDLDTTLIVDNSVDCCVGYTESNAIIVPDFRGLELEETLPTLCEFLEDLVESQVTVRDYLQQNAHNYFRVENRKPASLVGETVQCFVVDGRHATNTLAINVVVGPDHDILLSPWRTDGDTHSKSSASSKEATTKTNNCVLQQSTNSFSNSISLKSKNKKPDNPPIRKVRSKQPEEAVTIMSLADIDVDVVGGGDGDGDSDAGCNMESDSQSSKSSTDIDSVTEATCPNKG
eukprot:TRINITY_DN1567_c0_g3_i1.p1 TRINITY_DN1567_c0_g3~~TRINITY_DN1567_c0_g3_i1.p1  ORF type:complete len:648 (+),score=163.53 TRINITY_DN1567_c0_g3_i1:108-2051(+)